MSRFSGVVTTGIYCRAGCAGKPKQENVRDYEFAAAAEAAGFRPCLQCRPDKGPRWPDWLGPSEVVCRALHLIGQGALDEASVDELATRLGVGPRHLRRLFDTHVGASPIAIARSRRAHFARRLLDETDLSVAEIAFAAGFTSLRQFNRTMLDIFRYPPTGLRERRRRNDRIPGDAGLSVRLVYRPPLDWTTTIRYLAARAIPGVESVDEGRYRRTIEWEGSPGVIELAPDPGDSHLVLTVYLGQLAGLIHVVEQARRIFDLGADPVVITDALRRDPGLAPLVTTRPGLRVPGTWDPCELAVRAVLGQQVSVAAARTQAARLVERCGEPLPKPVGGVTHLFPAPEALAALDPEALPMPRARGRALVSLAAALACGLDARDRARLLALPGIGPWTADYVAMRCGDHDVLLETDLGVRRALRRLGRPEAELQRRAERWRPWRSYAVQHLWSVA